MVEHRSYAFPILPEFISFMVKDYNRINQFYSFQTQKRGTALPRAFYVIPLLRKIMLYRESCTESYDRAKNLLQVNTTELNFRLWIQVVKVQVFERKPELKELFGYSEKRFLRLKRRKL